MFEYLTEFWSEITEVVVSAGTYTVNWFESVGNAVAGAIGGMFAWLIHYLNDFFIFLGWVFSIIKELIVVFILPISYVFNFLKAFTISAFSAPQTAELGYSFSAGVLALFDAVPYWDTIVTVLGLAVMFFLAVTLLKLILWIT